jgi:hypothetical protein
MSLDIQDFYLNTPMSRPEYMRVAMKDIPTAINQYYGLNAIAVNGFVYCEISKGMYALPQAGILANDDLVIHLAKYGYIQSPHTPGLFTHNTRPISFCLVVDDFGTSTSDRNMLAISLKSFNESTPSPLTGPVTSTSVCTSTGTTPTASTGTTPTAPLTLACPTM